MKILQLFPAILLITVSSCSSDEKSDTATTKEKKSEEIVINQNENLPIKISQSDAIDGLTGKEYDAALWLYENYKGRLETTMVTPLLNEMGNLSMEFEFGDKEENEITNEINTFSLTHKNEIELTHFQAQHSCMHGFIGADESNPFFTEFEYLGKTASGDYSFNCTVSADNMDENDAEQKYIEVRQIGESYLISLIQCRLSID